MGKTLSISIAAYNVERYLEKAVRSCLTSNRDEIEVLIVNDGSTDSTLGIARRLEAENTGIVRVIDKQNGGYGSTLNASVATATGKYFYFLDGDDWYDTDILGELVALLGRTDADAIITSQAWCYEANGMIEIRDSFPDMKEGLYRFGVVPFRYRQPARTLIFRTELLQDIRIDITEHCFYTDQQFGVIPMAHVRTVYLSHLPVYQYRLGVEGQSVSIEGYKKHCRDLYLRLPRLLEAAEGSCVSPENAAYMRRAVAFTASEPYSVFCELGYDSEFRDVLRDIEALMKRHPDIYREMAGCYKKMRLLQATGLCAYRPLSWYKRAQTWIRRALKPNAPAS